MENIIITFIHHTQKIKTRQLLLNQICILILLINNI